MTTINKCEKCSMDGVYKNEEDGIISFFCKHHAPPGSVPVTKNVAKNTKNFTPLIVVILSILAVSLLRQFTGGWNSMLWMMDFMGVFLVTFGLFKIVDLKGFKEGFSTYDLIAKKIPAYGYVFPFIEICLGVIYLAGYMYLWQNIFVIILALLGTASAYLVIKNKDEIECVCLGTAFKIPMTWVTFVENMTMGIMAVWMILL